VGIAPPHFESYKRRIMLVRMSVLRIRPTFPKHRLRDAFASRINSKNQLVLDFAYKNQLNQQIWQ
jgi:hypothetical protein